MIYDVMEMTDITAMKKRLIRNLSKGYKQRVGLAQAILGDPEVIILDEPTVGLDPKQIIEMRDLMKELGKKHTVILSSHILSEVSEVCDHIFIISKGKLVASDSKENLSQRMEGAPEIRLEVKGEDQQIRQVLDGLKDVASYEVIGAGKNGLVQVTVTAAKDTDPREQLFYAFAEAKLPIFGMHMEKKSLEDVFLKLTQEEPIGKKKAKKRKKRMEDLLEDELERESEPESDIEDNGMEADEEALEEASDTDDFDEEGKEGGEA